MIDIGDITNKYKENIHLWHYFFIHFPFSIHLVSLSAKYFFWKWFAVCKWSSLIVSVPPMASHNFKDRINKRFTLFSWKKKLHNAFPKTFSVSVYCCKNANPSKQSNDEHSKMVKISFQNERLKRIRLHSSPRRHLNESQCVLHLISQPKESNKHRKIGNLEQDFSLEKKETGHKRFIFTSKVHSIAMKDGHCGFFLFASSIQHIAGCLYSNIIHLGICLLLVSLFPSLSVLISIQA